MPSQEPAIGEGIPAVLRVELDTPICSACEACVMICPEVFEIREGQVALKEGASNHYQSKAKEILDAERGCPVEAIWAVTDPPRHSPKARRASKEAVSVPSTTILEKLKYARDVAEGRMPTVVRRPWWKFW